MACIDGMGNAYTDLVRKPEGKRPLLRTACMWNVY